MYNRLAMEGLGTRLVAPLRFWRFYFSQILWLICPRSLDFRPFCRKRLFYTCKGRYFQFSRHDALRGNRDARLRKWYMQPYTAPPVNPSAFQHLRDIRRLFSA